MAHMHSRKRGKSKPHKPVDPVKPVWLRYGEKEAELLVTKLAKEGKKAAEIGLILRDLYGIPSIKIITNKRITKILSDKKLTPTFPEDMMNLMKRAVLIHKHLEKNKHDMTARRGLRLTESKILRLAKYYKRIERLPHDWKYSSEEISLLVAG